MQIKQRLQRILSRALEALQPSAAEQRARTIIAERDILRAELERATAHAVDYRQDEYERVAELVEAQQMRGAGPCPSCSTPPVATWIRSPPTMPATWLPLPATSCWRGVSLFIFPIPFVDAHHLVGGS